MRILLTAINAKYIHSNLAVYSLKASAGKYEPQVELAEYTINHQADEIFAGIYRRKPELLLFSCYVWNRREVLEAAASIKKVLPHTVIWAGGPEVTYDAVQFLQENGAFDGVMTGEGEQTFYRLLSYYIEEIGAPEEIPGIVWRDSAWGTKTDARAIHPNISAVPCTTLDSLPFVYRDLEQFENRIIYYESSRGCPFSCSYCLSSVDKSVRYRSMELVKQELSYFLEKRVKQVKFVDRTFNCNHARTLELWRFLRDHDNGVTNFHCEISADLLNEEELQVLSELRPGLLQLEIGVQTVNPDTLRAIHRTARFEQIAAHVTRIAENHNIHQHLDLIAGLPYEDFESFRTSFDAVYRLYPQELQLGFLKVLRGSEMHRRAKEYGILYRDTPPYEVLETRWITCDELLRLKEIEEMLEVYYNSQQFRNTIRAAEALFARPIELYEALADYYNEENLAGKSYSRAQRLEILRNFLKKKHAPAYFDELLILDLYLRENAKSRPAWAADLAGEKEQMIRFYRQEEEKRAYLPELSEMSWKQMMRMTHLERFSAEAVRAVYPEMVKMAYPNGESALYPDEKKVPCWDTTAKWWLLFSYESRDALTGDAKVTILRQEMTSALAVREKPSGTVLGG